MFTPGVLALAVMSTAFTSLAIATGFERRYGVIKRLGSSPLPRSGLLLGKVGALLLVEVLQVVVISAVGLAARLGPRRPGGVARRRRWPWSSAPPRSPSLGLFLAGVLRAEATLAAANLVYLLLMAGGAVVLPASAYGAVGDVVRWLPSGALGDAMRAAFIDGAYRLARPRRAARLGRRSAPSSPPGRSRGSDGVPERRPPVRTAGCCARSAGPRLVANIVLVVTGGAVRLTGSGPGLPDLAALHRRLVHPARRLSDVHAAIEFGNRMLTFVLVAVAVATFVAAWRSRPARRCAGWRWCWRWRSPPRR